MNIDYAFAYVSEGLLFADIATHRRLFIDLGNALYNTNALSEHTTPESYAEIKLYAHEHAENYKQTFNFLPLNIFTISIEEVEKQEFVFFQKLLCCDNQVNSSDNFFFRTTKTACYLPSFYEKYQNKQVTIKRFNELSAYSKIGATSFARNKNNIPDPARNFFYNLGYETLGEVFCSYGLWASSLSNESRGYGVMREGKFLGQVASMFGVNIGHDLYLSRLTSSVAAMADPEDKEVLLNFLLRSRVKEITIEEACEQLGINHLYNCDISIKAKITAQNLPQVISWLDSPQIKEQRIENSLSMRENLITHMENIISNSQRDILLFDLGYAGNILINLNKIFKDNALSTRFTGVFLLSSVGAIWTQKSGSIIRGFLAQNSAPVRFSTIYLRTPEIIEVCCSPKCGTTIGYESSGAPLCEEAPFPDWQYQQIEEVQHGILDYILDWQKEHNIFSGMHLRKGDFDIMAEQSREQLVRLIHSPTVEEAKNIGAWYYDENYGVKLKRQLFEKDACNESFYNVPDRTQVIWEQAWNVLRENEK